MDQSTLEHLAQIGEVRLWMRDGSLCWEICQYGDLVFEIGNTSIVSDRKVIAYGADAKSLAEFYESTLLDSVAEL